MGKAREIFYSFYAVSITSFFFELFLEIKFFLFNIFVYARPYIDGVPTHSIQQVTVNGHGGQNVKCYLKKEEKLRPKV
jgi:hypothetical protein